MYSRAVLGIPVPSAKGLLPRVKARQNHRSSSESPGQGPPSVWAREPGFLTLDRDLDIFHKGEDLQI